MAKKLSTGKAGGGYIFKLGKTYYLEVMVNRRRKKVSLRTDKEKVALDRAQEYLEPIRAKSREEMAVHIATARKLATAGKIEIADVWDAYEGSRNRPQSGMRTLADYARMWKQFSDWLAVDYPGIAHLAAINDDIAESYATHLKAERGLSPATFNKHRDTLLRITDTLLRRAGVGANPWRDIATESLDTVTKKELSADGVTKLFKKVDAPDDPKFKLSNRHEWQVIFRAGAFAGLRLADCVLMTWDCINLDTDQLSFVPLKTARMKKRVNLPIHPELRAQLETALTWREDDNEYVCPNLARRYGYNPSGICHDEIKVFEKAGFTVREDNGRENLTNVIGFHSLRHSFVSFCANAGVPLAVVQALVGHGSPAMTRHYTHIGKEAAAEAVNAIPSMNGTDKKELTDGHELTDRDKLDKIREIVTAANGLTKRDREILSVLNGLAETSD